MKSSKTSVSSCTCNSKEFEELYMSLFIRLIFIMDIDLHSDTELKMHFFSQLFQHTRQQIMWLHLSMQLCRATFITKLLWLQRILDFTSVCFFQKWERLHSQCNRMKLQILKMKL